MGLVASLQTIIIPSKTFQQVKPGRWQRLFRLNLYRSSPRESRLGDHSSQLAGLFLREEDFLENIGVGLSAFLKAEYFTLVDAEEEFHIKTIDILHEKLVHDSLGFSEGHKSQVGIFALELYPVGILVTARLLRVKHLVLLEL